MTPCVDTSPDRWAVRQCVWVGDAGLVHAGWESWWNRRATGASSNGQLRPLFPGVHDQ